MKRVTTLFAILLPSLVVGSAHATEVGTYRSFGLGVQLFAPTALIGKLFVDRNNAFDFGFGFWGYGRCYDANGNPYPCNDYYDAYSFHFDYLYEEAIVDGVVRLDWHVGVGGRTAFHGYYRDKEGYRDFAMFGRVPVGLDLAFRRPRWLEAYLEIGPGLWVFPPLHFDIDVGLGARAYF
ncbi:MAG: hypothetical protein JXP73_05940 [Deltaproteobacteria bacterium]|nr:hypothetical protein [Deltaproteobacteria bacterium]